MPLQKDENQSEYGGLCFMMGKKRGKKIKAKKKK
jgi:hypothetical protein